MGARFSHGGPRSAAAVALVLATFLSFASVGPEAPVAAQPAPATPGATADDPAFFTATGYKVSFAPFWNYFLARGGVWAFGYPVSNAFQLEGRRVQIFQRQVMEARPDGSVGTVNLLDSDYLPITRLNGSTFPAADPALTANLPKPDDPNYLAAILTYIRQAAPGEWNGQPVGFGWAFLNTLACADIGETSPCSDDLGAGFDLEIWGVPTSLPRPDPNNPDFVYLRFQRGIMQFTASEGTTQGLLLGDWFKRVLIGGPLPPDLRAEVANSRFFAQYAPAASQGVSRPSELADTSLLAAFSADQQSATALADLPADTPVPPTATPVQATSTPAPAAPRTPPPDVVFGCTGDEQMFFVPDRPYVGTDAVIVVTSSRRHDPQYLRLTGPLRSGTTTERAVPGGWAWEWTVSPTIEGWYPFTFYADGIHPCITSGFNVQSAVGATATPTPVGSIAPTPGITDTPTPTPAPRPQIASVMPTTQCNGRVVTVFGSGFGTGSGNVFVGGEVGNVLSWSETSVSVTVPSELGAGPQTIALTNSAGFAAFDGFVARGACGTATPLTASTATPTPTPITPTSTPTPTPTLAPPTQMPTTTPAPTNTAQPPATSTAATAGPAVKAAL